MLGTLLVKMSHPNLVLLYTATLLLTNHGIVGIHFRINRDFDVDIE